MHFKHNFEKVKFWLNFTPTPIKLKYLNFLVFGSVRSSVQFNLHQIAANERPLANETEMDEIVLQI